jgi:hypothetical protein
VARKSRSKIKRALISSQDTSFYYVFPQLIFSNYIQSQISLLPTNIKVKIYKTWSLILRKEHKLRVFENRFLRRICGSKRDEVKGEWRKLHSEKFHILYLSPDIIRQVKSRRMRWARRVERMGEERNVYRVLVGKPEGTRPFGRPRRKWENGIRMDLKETGYGGLEWIKLAQDRDRWRALVNTVMNLRVLAPRN